MEFIDLKAQYRRIKPSIQKRINDVLDRGSYIMGSEVAELEEKLAAYTGTSFCVTCSSGTDALLLPLMAMGIGQGDAVFTTTFTFIATAEIISLLGATPVFVDIDKRTYNLDPEKLRAEIIKVKNGEPVTGSFPRNLKPKAVIPVDLFGLCADYDAIGKIVGEFGLLMLEDAAQSFGALYKGKKACSFGDMAATSFFPAKPLGCYGDGGAIFCKDKETAGVLRSLRVHGQGSDKYENVRIGINGRLDTLQAAVLLSKMEVFEGEIERRQTVASRYSNALQSRYTVPVTPSNGRSVWAQYSLIGGDRAEKIAALKSAGIPSAIYYPKPLHLQKAFASLGYEEGQCPVAEEIAAKIFSIPMHPYLEEKEQDKVLEVLLK